MPSRIEIPNYAITQPQNLTGAMEQKAYVSNCLQYANNLVEYYIASDGRFPDLIVRMQVSQGQATNSGTAENYKNFDGVMSKIKELKSTNKIPIPREVVDQRSRESCVSLMGLFPDVRRAWVTVNSDIYIWDFEYGTDVCYYDGLNEAISCVALVRPKPNVFQRRIQYLLVLTTHSTITVLGVTFQLADKNSLATDEMHIVPEIIFSLSTDNAVFSTISHSEIGRIFLGGKDGCLYEFYYQKELSWWGKRCKLINHSTMPLSALIPSFFKTALSSQDNIIQICVDDRRNLLYTLSGTGTIEMYDLSDDGLQTSKLLSYTFNAFLIYAKKIINSDDVHIGAILKISVISVYESFPIGLLAICDNGFRCYFALDCGNTSRPHSMQMIHIRFPPDYEQNSLQNAKYHHPFYINGTLVLLKSDPCYPRGNLICCSSDLFPYFDTFVESSSACVHDSSVPCIFEEVPAALSMHSATVNPPLVVRQHYEPPATIVSFTNQGTEILQKLRPCDILSELFIGGHGPSSDVVSTFLNSYPDDENCAMLLLLACHGSTENMRIAEMATSAFFLYGGKTKMADRNFHPAQQQQSYHLLDAQSGFFHPSSISTPVGYASVPDEVRRIMLSPPMPTDHHPSEYSSKHNGLYLFLARTLRPIWHLPAISFIPDPSQDNAITVAPDLYEKCKLVLNHLLALKSFLNTNTSITTTDLLTGRIENANVTPVSSKQRDSLRGFEKKSLDSLREFVDYTSQVLGLWKILQDHDFTLLFDSLTQDEKNVLCDVTFAELVVSKTMVCGMLITKLLTLYLNDNASVDSVCSKLRETCPTLYKAEDAACTKANEMIVKAKGLHNEEERRILLNESLTKLKDVSPNINLSMICHQYMECGFYVGIYELCKECACKLDAEDRALAYYFNMNPNIRNNTLNHTTFIYPEEKIYKRRMECYEVLISILNDMHGTQDISSVIDTSQMAVQNDVINTKNEAFRELLDLCLSSEDELMHCAIYEWLVKKGLALEMIKRSHVSVEHFLKRPAAASIYDSRHIKDLLWKYYARHNNHAAAADVLYALAIDINESIKLEDRIHYLSHANMCLRSQNSGSNPSVGILYHQVEEMLPVAHIQKGIQNEFDARGDVNEVRRLDVKLFTLSELYEEFAETFELWEFKLKIIECSTVFFCDDDVIHQIWENILSTEYKKCTSPNPDEKLTAMLNKTVSILKDLRADSPAYTLDYLLFQLEIASCRLQASKDLVVSAMIDAEIPFANLVEIYDRMLTLGNECWDEGGDEYHLTAAMATLAEHYLKNTNVRMKPIICLKLSDMVTHSLNLLHSRPADSQVDTLIRWMTSIQTRLSKL